MGHVVFPMIINDLDDEKHTLSYTIDNWKPALEDYDVIPVKKGKTNIKDVEIVYNTKELR
ncbi:hypothetical protein B808_526 [Fructilactobacillus florum 8D]|uniref:Uncharacterized protein n=2 Tax=Fructilactobacillus florum TaxID=640331 RepID=W9EES0_9LACO|nr:hypothetical protein B808_526 [Fructilactobacillus florum 8D]